MKATNRVKHFYSHAKFGEENKYDNNADCEWSITAKSGQIIELKFLEFDVRNFVLLRIAEKMFYKLCIFSWKVRNNVHMTMLKYTMA